MPKIEEIWKNPLRCNGCNQYMSILIEVTKAGWWNVDIRMPTYHCEKCDKKEYFNWKLCDIYNQSSWVTKYPIEPGWTAIYKQLGFKYDFLDYYCIPWLFRDFSNDWHLTPVFFEKELLLHYNNHPDFKVNLSSYSSWGIDYKWESFLTWWFGINKNDKLFMRLGDLYDLFKDWAYQDELHRFRASNIESDHEVVSDYYFNQIEVNFTDSDNEKKIFSLFNMFNKKIRKRFGFDIFNVDISSLDLWYKPPILDEKNQVFNSYSQLSKFLVETIAVWNIKEFLREQDTIDKSTLKGKGWLKLLEIFVNSILDVDKSLNVLCPLFVLYDLRILSDHLSLTSFESTYYDCKDRLDFKQWWYLEFHKCVITKIIDMFNDLLSFMEK